MPSATTPAPPPIAEENLRDLVLSLTTAKENIAVHDDSLQNLVTIQTHEIAFFAIEDLILPKDSVSGTVSSNFISPMSTQIRELMATGKTMQQAMDQMGSQLKLPAGTDLLADYMTNPGNANSQAMHSATRNMASLMGSQMSQVLSSSGSTPTVDVNRYRGMMGAIFSNMSSIKGPGSSTDTKTAMSNLMGTMAANLPTIAQGQPYRNMSSFFKAGMGGAMGGTRNSGVGM